MITFLTTGKRAALGGHGMGWGELLVAARDILEKKLPAEKKYMYFFEAGAGKLRGRGANPTPGSTPGTFIVNHIFLFWVSFYWMSLLLYVFVYTLVLLVLSLFHGSSLRNWWRPSSYPSWDTRDMGCSLVLTLYMFFSTNMNPFLFSSSPLSQLHFHSPESCFCPWSIIFPSHFDDTIGLRFGSQSDKNGWTRQRFESRIWILVGKDHRRVARPWFVIVRLRFQSW